MSGPEKENAPRRETGGAPEGDRRHLVPGEKVPETGDGRECGDLLTFLRGWWLRPRRWASWSTLIVHALVAVGPSALRTVLSLL